MKKHIHYFGYGSLINLATIQTPYKNFHRATLHGWRRVWQVGENHALLSVEKKRGSKIQGLVICDEADSLQKLNKREIAYKKQNIQPSEIEWLDTPANKSLKCFLYISNYEGKSGRTSGTKILRSYLDAILQGVLIHFGETGVHNFFQSTKNFMAVAEDRHSPIYPRAIRLSKSEQNIIDSIAKNYKE